MASNGSFLKLILIEARNDDHHKRVQAMMIKNMIMASPLKGGSVPHVCRSPDNHLHAKISSRHDVVFNHLGDVAHTGAP